MPFLKEIIINEKTKIKLWKVKIGELDASGLDNYDTYYLNLKKNHLAKEQFLAVRKTLQLENPNYKIRYDELGKPSINSNLNISISHSNQLAGIVLSKTKNIGIDIELLRKKVFNIKDKFLTEKEKIYLNNNLALELLTLIWVSKESIFKALKIQGVIFSKNIQINKFSYLDSYGSGYYTNGDIIINFNLFFFYLKNYVICFAEKNNFET